MSDDQDTWPDYHIGTSGHLHAIGVLITNWNQIEGAYQALIQLIFPSHLKSGIRTFQLLSNEQRVKLIREELIPVLSKSEAEHVDHFLKMANICYANRNVFAHATAHPTTSEGKFRMSEGTGKKSPGAQYLFELQDIREMADASYTTFMYGVIVFSIIEHQRAIANLAAGAHDHSWLPPMSLPNKPSLPRSWDQIREIPIPPEPPPQSSPA